MDQRKTNIKKSNECETFSDLFLLTINKTKLDTHVSTLAILDSIVENYDVDRGYGIAKVKPIPLYDNQKEYSINVYFFFDNTRKVKYLNADGNFEADADADYLSQNELVLIVFSDYNFENNLHDLTQQLDTNDDALHQLSCGIMIKLSNQSYVDYKCE